MPELDPLYNLVARLPFDCMQWKFMQQALVGLLLLAPMAAAMGVQVVNFRMAFFTDAISHSAFSGVAIGLILGLHPRLTMPAFALLLGIGITATRRRSSLSTDTIIGVFFSAVVAFGLAVVSRDKNVARDVQQFVYGSILSISNNDIWAMIGLFVVLMAFQAYGYNRLLYIGLNPALAQAHRVRVAVYQYVYAALLSLIVILSVQAVGMLLVTAMLVVPAATARNFARSAGGMIWWAVLVSVTSAAAGLLISFQEDTAAGPTIILVAFCWFLLSTGVGLLRGERAR